MTPSSGASLSGASIVVLGGNVPGLAAALELSRLGPDSITVIEKEAPATADAAKPDPRPLALGAISDGEAVKRLRELFGDAVVERVPNERLSVNGRLLPSPPTRMNLYSSFGTWESLRFMFGWALSGFRKPAAPSDAQNLERWLIGQAGDELYRRVYRAQAMKIWNVEPQRLPATVARARASEFTVANGASAAAPRYEVAGGVEAMRARLLEKLAGKAEVLYKSTLDGFDLDSPTRIQGVYARNADGERRLDADIVVSALPIETLNPLLDLDEEEDVRPVNLRWRGVRTLFLTVDAAFPAGVDRVYVSEPGSRIHSAQPAPGGVAVDVICNEGDEVWRMRDEKLADIAVEDLIKAGLVKEGTKARGGFSVHSRGAVPVQSQGWEDALRRAYARLNAVENLFMIGRRALFLEGTPVLDLSMARSLGAFMASGSAGKGDWNRAVRGFAPQAQAGGEDRHRRRG